MGVMTKRLPDEFFRESPTSESQDVVDGSVSDHQPRRSRRASQRTRTIRDFSPPVVLAGLLGALLLGFSVGKLVTLQSEESAVPEPIVSSASATPSPTQTGESNLAPFNGAVRVVPALDATGRCLNELGDGATPPSNLIDDDAGTHWRCVGSGVGESIAFVLPTGEELVGVRLVNGNTSSYDRYLAERRILSVKWEFSDGSWVVQPLAANDREPQEFRFPPTTVTGPVVMTVMDATVTGNLGERDEDNVAGVNDAVSISSLQFLGVE